MSLLRNYIVSRMSIRFGFSASDFVTALEPVGTVIDALRDSGGSGREYRELRVELNEYQNEEAIAIALRQAASQCQRTSDGFLAKIQNC